MKAQFRRSEVGLLPASDESREWFSKLRLGATVEGDFVQPRNPLFHRKMMALFQLGFDYWCDIEVPLEYKGRPVTRDFDHFRKDITILAGFYKLVANINGDVRPEADSLSYGSMNNDRFTECYTAVLSVLLTKIFNQSPQWSRERIESVLSHIQEFC